jgi:hypothetical protein
MNRKSYIALLGLLLAAFILSIGAQTARAQDMDDGGADEPEAKPPVPTLATGGWCGSMTDALHGTGAFFMDLNQNKRNLDGTWSTDISDFSGGKSGTFTGKIESDNTTVTLKLKQSGQKGGFLFKGTLINNHNLTGMYSTFGRKPADSGSASPESPCV